MEASLTWELSYFNKEPYEESDGPNENEFEEQCKHLDAIYHGYKADVLPYYMSCHLLILPSYGEGRSMCLLKAMAVEIPCLASDVYVIKKYSMMRISIKPETQKI